MKQLHKGILAILAMLVLTVCMPSVFGGEAASVKAADFKTCGRSQKTGKYYIWSDNDVIRISEKKTGNGEVMVQAVSGGTMGYSILSDGKSVFYEEKKLQSGYHYTSYIYRYSIPQKSSQLLAKVQDVLGLAACYKDNLYIECYDKEDSTLIHTYRLNTKTKKVSRCAKNACVSGQKGKYLLLRPNTGAYIDLPLYSYDCKSGKKKLIEKKTLSIRIIGEKLYYVKAEGYNNWKYQWRLYSCSLNGSGKKVVSPVMEGSEVSGITKKYVYYSSYGTSGSFSVTYYQYSIQTKKRKKISESKYRAAVSKLYA